MGSRAHKRTKKAPQPKPAQRSKVIYDIVGEAPVPTAHLKFEELAAAHAQAQQPVEDHKPLDAEEKAPVADADFQTLSKRQQRKVQGWTLGKLKLAVNRPELVETHDVNAQFPLALIDIRSARNIAKVPPNWAIRRKYLSRKRQLNLLTNYELPPQVAATRVATIRKYYVDRARAQLHGKPSPHEEPPRPDFDAMRDCFYHYTFVNLYRYGDLYYEGREAELDSVDARPGVYSNRLRTALGMPLNVVAPPPWLTHMQVHGPPPGYPLKRFPGVNAPLPKGERWGHEVGQWGRPPTDANNPRGKWGNLFVHATETPSAAKTVWEKPSGDIAANPAIFSSVVDSRWEKIVGVSSKRGQTIMGEFVTQRRAAPTQLKPVVTQAKLPDVVKATTQDKNFALSTPIGAKPADNRKPGEKRKNATSMRF